MEEEEEEAAARPVEEEEEAAAARLVEAQSTVRSSRIAFFIFHFGVKNFFLLFSAGIIFSTCFTIF